MKKIIIVLFILLILLVAYFSYQSLKLQRQLGDKVSQLITEETLNNKKTPDVILKENTQEDTGNIINDNALQDTKNIDYGVALSRVDNIGQLISLFHDDLNEEEYSAYGYKAHELYKEKGIESFVSVLASTEDISLQEETSKAIVGELNVLRDVDKTIDLQVYIDELVEFSKRKDLTAKELSLTYDLRWKIEALKKEPLE